MVEFDVNKNLNSLGEKERWLIKQAVDRTHNKMRPDSESLNYLYSIFKENIDPKFSGTCGRCKRRVTTYWKTRLTSWGMH